MARSIIEHTSKFMNQPRLLTSSDDMDNLTQAGFYTQAENDLPANAPSDNPYNAGIVVLKARAGAETIQIWFSVNSATCWYRAKGAYTTWGSWHKVMVGGVISKLLSEVMTASGGRHDECDYKKGLEFSIGSCNRYYRDSKCRVDRCLKIYSKRNNSEISIDRKLWRDVRRNDKYRSDWGLFVRACWREMHFILCDSVLLLTDGEVA